MGIATRLPQLKRWEWITLSLVALPVLLFLLLCLGTCSGTMEAKERMRLNRERVEQAQLTARVELADDAIIGLSKQEIAKLFGEPTWKNEEAWSYYLRTENSPLFGLNKIRRQVLFEDGKVRGSMITDD